MTYTDKKNNIKAEEKGLNISKYCQIFSWSKYGISYRNKNNISMKNKLVLNSNAIIKKDRTKSMILSSFISDYTFFGELYSKTNEWSDALLNRVQFVYTISRIQDSENIIDLLFWISIFNKIVNEENFSVCINDPVFESLSCEILSYLLSIINKIKEITDIYDLQVETIDGITVGTTSFLKKQVETETMQNKEFNYPLVIQNIIIIIDKLSKFPSLSNSFYQMSGPCQIVNYLNSLTILNEFNDNNNDQYSEKVLQGQSWITQQIQVFILTYNIVFNDSANNIEKIHTWINAGLIQVVCRTLENPFFYNNEKYVSLALGIFRVTGFHVINEYLYNSAAVALQMMNRYKNNRFITENSLGILLILLIRENEPTWFLRRELENICSLIIECICRFYECDEVVYHGLLLLIQVYRHSHTFKLKIPYEKLMFWPRKNNSSNQNRIFSDLDALLMKTFNIFNQIEIEKRKPEMVLNDQDTQFNLIDTVDMMCPIPN